MTSDATAVIAGDFTHVTGLARRSTVRPFVLALLGMLVFLTVLARAGSFRLADMRYGALNNQAVAAAAPAPKAAPSPSNSGGTQAPAVVSQSGTQVTSSCTPNTTYGLPAGLDLTSAPAGLTQVVDSPAYYNIYGTSVGQIGQELNACAPHFAGTVADANYLAYTSYHLSWQYDYAINSNGLCVLSNIKVGQHISQIFPRWDSAGQASSTITAKWQSFNTALQAHESGHVALNEQYANQLLVDLQALPALNCSTVSQTVNATASHDVAALNQAHLGHDQTTNYGATEGALWQ